MTEHEYELEQDLAAEYEHRSAIKEQHIIEALRDDPASAIERLVDSLGTYIADDEGSIFESVYDRDHEAIVDAIEGWWLMECEQNWDTY